MSYARYGSLSTSSRDTTSRESDVYVIPSNEIKRRLINDHKVVVIYNYASWCGPCKAIASDYVNLVRNYNSPECVLVKEDVDDNLDPIQHPQVNAVPCFFFFLNGKYRSDMTINEANIGAVARNIQRLLN
jgi:thioredoxin 1